MWSWWAVAFALTLAFEVPAGAWWWSRAHGVGLTRGATVTAAASLLTHPLLWFGWMRPLGPALGVLVVGEAIVIAVEAIAYALAMNVTAREAAAVSLALNLLSAVVGGAVMELVLSRFG